MRLEISRKTDLATQALIALGEEGSRIKASVLAERLGTSPGFLSHAMTPLAAAGIVRSKGGPTGGYELITPLEQLDVLTVVEAVEGPTDTGICVLSSHNCSSTTPCAMHVAWSSARTEFLTSLRNTMLTEFVGKQNKNGGRHE